MSDNVKRVVTADVYAWMTSVEGVPGRFQHNTASRGDTVEVSEAEAKRGEGLGALEDPSKKKANEPADGEAAGDESPATDASEPQPTRATRQRRGA